MPGSSNKFDRGASSFAVERIRDVTKLPAAEEFSGLRSGPQFQKNYETQQGIPVDGSKKILRSMSPFTISVLPPLVFENIPTRDALAGVRDALAGLDEGARRILFGLSGLFGPEQGSRADLVLEAALAEFNSNIQEPKDFDPRGLLRINEYIRSDQGSGWTTITYTHDGQKGADWCGHFAAFVYGAAGLNEESRRKKLQSTRRLYNWGRENPNRLIGGVDSDGFPIPPGPDELQPGDIVVVGRANDDKKQGRHITIVESVTSDGVFTIEGNARGEGPDGSRSNGVIKTFRPFTSSDPSKYVVRYGIRPTPDDYAEPYYGDTAFGDAGFFGPPQSRNTNGNTPQPGLIDAALSRNNGFRDGKFGRRRAALSLVNSALGGRGRDVVRPEEFVAAGERQRNDNGGFDEPGIADKVQGVDVIAQLNSILQTPPLTLLINPSSFQVNYTKIQQFNQRARDGYIFQAWGEEQPKLTINGSIGAFIAAQNPQVGFAENGQTASPSGVQFASKRDSASFQNLMNLLTFYKHNGYIYDNLGEGSNANLFVGAIAIDYDNWTYIGHFESFSWGYDESDTQNGKITFDLEFTVSQMYDNQQASFSIKPMRSPTQNPGDLGFTLADAVSSPFPVDEIPEGSTVIRPDDARVGGEAVEGGNAPAGQSDLPSNTDGFIDFEFDAGDGAQSFIFNENSFDEEGNLIEG